MFSGRAEAIKERGGLEAMYIGALAFLRFSCYCDKK